MTFLEKLDAAVTKNNSLLCVGLDPNGEQPLFEFNKEIIDATADLVCAYKPNSAFYEAKGAEGIEQLKQTCNYIRSNHPDIPIILDAKRGDNGNSNNGYVAFVYDYLKVDAVTHPPYMGQKSLQPFLDRSDKGVIILCRNSNEGTDEFQLLESGGKKLYQIVAENVVKNWNKNRNCLLVAGATYPEELADIRRIVGDMVLLAPGVGAQGGDVEATLKAGLNSQKRGLIIASSRGIIYAENPRQAAKDLRDQINQYR